MSWTDLISGEWLGAITYVMSNEVYACTRMTTAKHQAAAIIRQAKVFQTQWPPLVNQNQAVLKCTYATC